MKVEILKADDIPAIRRCMEIRRNVFIIEKGVAEEIEIDEYDCVNDMCEHFLVRYEDRDVGTVRCLHTSDDTVRLQRFCFLKSCRGMGLGRTVIEYIENHCRDEGITTVEMDAKYQAFRFYEKCGYEKASEVFIEAGVEHVKMIKEI